MKPRVLSVVRLSFPLASAIAALLASPSIHAQTVRSWTGASTAPWLTTTNWSPSGTFAGGAPLADPAGEGANTDIMAVAAANAATNVGINMNTLAAAGGVGLVLGGIDFNKTNTATLQIGNSSTTVNGILQLNGSTINAVPNTLIRVAGSANLTIANVNTGSTSQTMGLRLGITNGIFDVGAGRTLTISSIISQATANSGLTKTGTGVLTLSGVNSYDGTVVINAGTLSINSFTTGGIAGSLGMASNAPGNLVMAGGTLSYTGGSTSTDRGITFGALTGNPIISVTTASANLNLSNTIAGTVGQQIDFTKGGNGTLTLSNNNNSYIGRTFASGGTLAVTSISSVGPGTSSLGVATTAADGLISIGTGTTTTTLSYIGTGNTTDRNLDLPGTAGGGVIDQSGTGLLKFTGAVTATGIGSKILTLGGSTSGTGEIAGVIPDNGTAGTTVATAASTASTALVLGSVVGLTVGNPIAGTGIPGGTTISAVNSATRTVTLSAAATVASGAVITSAGLVNITSLTKSGTGTWALSGANSYTGATTVNAGTLDLGGGAATGSLSSPTLTLVGGTFSYTRTGSATQAFTTTNINGTSQISVVSGNTLDLGTVVRGPGGSLDFSTTGAGTVAALAASNVNGIMPGLTFGGTWAVANGTGVAISGLGSYTLTSVAGTTGGSYLNGNIDVDNNAGLIDSAITANSLRFSSAAANSLTLAAGSNTLSAGGILVGSTVGSNVSTITGGTLTGAANQKLAIVQNNTSGGLTISSSIVDNTSTSVSKSGAGLLTIDAANTYTGGTTIIAGTLKLSGAGTLGPVGASVAVNSGALLDLNGTSQNIAFAAGAGVGTVANNSGGGTSTLTVAGTLSNVTIADNTNSSSGKVAVVIGGTAQGPSNLNSYSGGTTVNAGAFFYLSGGAVSGAGTGPINLTTVATGTGTGSGLLVDGGTYVNDITGPGYVHINGPSNPILTGNLNTSGPFIFRSGTTGSFEFAGNGTTSVLSGVIGSTTSLVNGAVATGSIIKSGTGTLTLSGANAYTGATTISGGILRVSGGGAIPNAGLVTLADAPGASLEVLGSETMGALAGGGASGGAVSIDASQTLTLSSGTQTHAGTISGAGTLTSAGAVQTLNGALSILGGVNVTSGTLTLGSTGNTYSGVTAVSAAAAGIIVTADGALGATGSGNGTTVGAAGTLGFSGGVNYSTAETISGSGGGNAAGGTPPGFPSLTRGFIQSVSGNNTFAGNIELSADGTSRIGTQDGAQLNLTGTITQGASITTANILFRVGNLAGDFVTLSNAGNSFGGNSAVFTSLATPGQYAGLRIGIDNAHPTNLTIQNFSSASGSSTALDLNGNDQALNGLSSGGAGSLNVINLDTGNASTLTLNPTVDKNSGANIVILGGSPGGTSLGVINFVKDGSFNQTLSGANSHTGTTTVNDGTLTLGNAAALGAGSASVAGGSLNLGGQTITNAVSVGAAGTLTGSGSTGAATLAGGLTPGGSGSGLITLASATVASTSVITLQLPATGTRGTNYDAVTVSGTLALDGTITVNIPGLTPAAGQSFDLIDSSGSIDVTNFNIAADLGLPGLGGGLVWDTSAFASTGVVSIANGDPFPAWALAKGLDGTAGKESGKNDDPDKDGRTNLDEFAFDGNPLSGANDGKIVGKIATVSGSQVMTLTLPVRNGAIFAASSGDQLSALIDGLYYRIEGDKTLGTFADSIVEVSPAITAGLPTPLSDIDGDTVADWSYRTFTFAAPDTVLTVPKAFLRAKVSETP